MAKKIGIISDTHGLLRPQVMEILKTWRPFMQYGETMTGNGQRGWPKPCALL